MTDAKAILSVMRAVKALPILVGILERVLELHRPFGVYDECGHEHSEVDIGLNGVVYVDEIGYTCEAGKFYDICYHCGTDEGEMREDSDSEDVMWPCPTVRLIQDGLRGAKP